MSTIGIAGTDRCAELSERRGMTSSMRRCWAPRRPPSRASSSSWPRVLKLCATAGGPDLRRRRRRARCGSARRAQGTRLKMAVNTWILAVVEGAAETLALAEGLGLDPTLVLDAVAGGPLDLPYLQMKGKAMIARDFEPSFEPGARRQGRRSRRGGRG